MDSMTLLHEAQAAGLSVSADDGRLVVRGPKRHEALAQRVLAQKVEVLAAIAQAGIDPLFPPEVMAGLRAADVRLVDEAWVDPWATAVDPPEACEQCGSLEMWQSVAGDLSGVAPGKWRCVQCDPPETARRLRALAERLRT